MKKLFFVMKQLVYLGNRVDEINQWRSEIMATIKDLKDAVAAERAEVKARVDELEAMVVDLQNGGTGGATPEQLEEVLVAIKDIFTPKVDAPVEPVEPVDPVDPVVPVAPADPVAPTESVDPAKPAEPVVPVTPVIPGDPIL